MEVNLEKELRESVDYFEQILRVLPGDRTALEFLCVACRQLGDEEKFFTYALTLVDLTIREKNVESAANLIEKLKDSEDPRARAAILKLEMLVAPPPNLVFEKPEDRVTSATPAEAARAELDLLKRLVTEGVLTQSLVQVAFDQLENLPTSGVNFLISSLAILEKENLAGAADALAAVADAAHAPPVPLESFEFSPALVRRLPEPLVRVRGAIPFAKLADEWAVVVLNPLDQALREEIMAALGSKCHFFLAAPSSVEKVLSRIYADEERAEEPSAPPPALQPVPPPALNPLS